ncbi:unnamed protein product [Closterium sp. NIES-64]|nr:unnamed protein product [Closterium sp. NIES-64]
MTAIFLGLVILVVAALLAAIGVSVTINTRRLREKTAMLAALKEQAEVAERNKSVFVANTAHELRTPINGMEGMLKHLDERGLDEEQKEDVGAVVEQAEKILSLVNTVLDVCKAEAGRLHLESLPFDLRSWLRDALHSHVHAAQEQGLNFTWHVDGDVPSVVVGDYLRLQQVVDRIVDNAVKFTSSGGVCVRVQCLPPHTHIPAHLLSLGCLVTEPTPCCSSPAAATTAAKPAAAATAAAASAAGHRVGAGEPLIRASLWEQVGQRGLARVVTGACSEWVVQRGLAAQCLECYWRMPPVQEGGPEQEESEEKGGREEREEGEERVSVREQSDAYQESGGDGGGERPGGAQVGDAGCRETGAALIPLRPRAAVHGAASAGEDAGSAAGSTAPGDGAVGSWRRAVGRCWRARGREQGTEAEGGGDRRCVVVLTCEDTGCGIAEEVQRHVFQAFMQTRAHGGSGMSLHLCRQLVALMGGRIGLLSTESHGTTLHVTLPMAVAAATAAAPVGGNPGLASANTSGPQATCAASSSSGDEAAVPRAVETKSASESLKELLQGKAILVVDDNAINRRVAASTLARYGAQVALAESGDAALRLLQAPHSFRLVLMDLQMPGLDGFHTTARLRALEAQANTAHEGLQGGQEAKEEQGGQGSQGVQCMAEVGKRGTEGGSGGWQGQQHIHVVAMSADVDSTVAARATQAGMDGAVQKPLNERLLLQVLSTLNGL